MATQPTERIESFLSGRWECGRGDGAELVNPTTEEVVARASTEGLDFSAGLAHARAVGGPALRAMTFEQRGEMLLALSQALHGKREVLIESAISNGGCTRGDAKFDVDGAIAVLAAYADFAKSLGPQGILADGEGIQLGRSPRFWGQHVYVPRRGVAVLINAFNFPAWGFAEKAACAWAAGVPIVTKPATATGLTAYLATRALVDSGALPDGAIGFVGGSAGDLLDHVGGQDLLAFTGSASTGQRLRSHPKIVQHSVPVNVEADSLNAAVLGPDVELSSETWSMFVREVAREMTQKTGQKCTAVRRVFVPAERVDDVISGLGEQLDEIRIGDPSEDGVRMGPLATAQQKSDVTAGLQLLQEDGDVAYTRGVDRDRGYFFPIHVLAARDALAAKHVHNHEVFGPVVTVLPYDGTADRAAELVCRGEGGLVASVYSDDRKFTQAALLGIAPFHGRVYLASAKVAEYTMGSGLVLPSCVHGGPGRAGGGEELGGIRGIQHFMQRTAVQGYRPLVETFTHTKK